MRALKLSSASTSEPVTVDELKTHLRIQTTAEDSLLDTYITAARKQCENMIKRALVPSSWLLVLDSFEDAIDLPRAPLSSASTDVVITYINTTGGTSTLSSTVYDVDSDSEPGQVRLGYEQSWPDDLRDTPGAVRIAYASGYTTTTIPNEIKQWIKMRAGSFYNHRESLLLDSRPLVEIPRDFVDGLLDGYRVIDL